MTQLARVDEGRNSAYNVILHSQFNYIIITITAAMIITRMSKLVGKKI